MMLAGPDQPRPLVTAAGKGLRAMFAAQCPGTFLGLRAEV